MVPRGRLELPLLSKTDFESCLGGSGTQRNAVESVLNQRLAAVAWSCNALGLRCVTYLVTYPVQVGV